MKRYRLNFGSKWWHSSHFQEIIKKSKFIGSKVTLTSHFKRLQRQRLIPLRCLWKDQLRDYEAKLFLVLHFYSTIYMLKSRNSLISLWMLKTIHSVNFGIRGHFPIFISLKLNSINFTWFSNNSSAHQYIRKTASEVALR